MAEELDMIKAKEVYDTIVSMMDAIGWKYEKHEEKLLIKTTHMVFINILTHS